VKKVATIALDIDALIEVWVAPQDEKIIFNLRGAKSEREITSVSVSLDEKHAEAVIKGLQAALYAVAQRGTNDL
jgi:hypothetical protein